MAGRLALSLIVSVLTMLVVPAASAGAQAATPAPANGGYWLVGADGRTHAFGAAAAAAVPAPAIREAVGVAAAPAGGGYWVTSRRGDVAAAGAARRFGSMAGRRLSAPVVGMAATPSGLGYWLVASDGGIFAFGDARFHGSTGAMRLNQPVVGMAATPTGLGYWLVAADGGIFAFGDARFHGSTGALVLDRPVVGMERSPSGGGYWLVAADGGIFSFGDVRYHGSTGGRPLAAPVVDMSATPSGGGYWLVGADGAVFAFGTAAYHGGARTGGPTVAPTGGPIVGMASLGPAAWHTLLAAGDISVCSRPDDAATAALLDDLEGTVAAIGDLSQDRGSVDEFRHCFNRAWGRHRHRTRPAVGNHEYMTPGAGPYWDYFGSAAGRRGEGWYSYRVGTWKVIVLNSNCDQVDCNPGSAQLRWLETELATEPALCTVAYWHHPRFSSGAWASRWSQPFWDALHRAGAELVLNGHDHVYERFAELAPDGRLDPGRGIRQITVGTGGGGRFAFRSTPEPGSEVRHTGTFGVLKLDLLDGAYRWRFVPEAGKSFTDAGTTRCH